MKKGIYAVYDKVAEIYANPFYLINNGIALRSASEALKDPKSEITKNPQDYILFHIGDWEDTTATIIMLDIPETICKFHEIQQMQDVTNEETPDLLGISRAQAI